MTMIHDDFQTARGVVAFNALGGISGPEAHPLWTAAEEAGFDLDAFVDDVLALAGPLLRLGGGPAGGVRRRPTPPALGPDEPPESRGF